MGDHGSILVLTLALMILLISLAGGFLYATGVFIGNSGWQETDAQLFWLAEAGLQKAIWYLRTPVSGGGHGEDWPLAGTQTATESLGAGSYTMVVQRWDFALASNGSSTSAKSSNGSNVPGNAIDNNSSTFWESGSNVTNSNAEWIRVALPYTLTVLKVRFIVPSGSSPNRPRNYTWEVSNNGSSWTPAKSVTGNSCLDRTDTFTAQPNVNYVRLNVTRTGTNNRKVRVHTLEIIGARITSTGTMTMGGDTYTRSVVQTVATIDGVTVPACSTVTTPAAAYNEPDWMEQ